MVNREGVLATAPLHFVLAGVRFKLRESMHSWIGPIQERLYDNFPHFRRVRHSLAPGGLELNIDPPDFDPAHSGAAFLFSDSTRRTAVQIHKSGVAVFTKDYVKFAGFLESVSVAFEALLASAEFLEVETIGIRYLDFIRPKDGERLDLYLDRSLLPFQPSWPDWAGKVAGGLSLNNYTIGDDNLNVRVTGRGYPVVPDDLALAYISSLDVSNFPGDPIGRIGDQQATLDMDAVKNQLVKVKRLDQITLELDRLHSHANAYFRNACTDHAFSVWNQEAR